MTPITLPRATVEQALEALEDWDSPVSLPAITALRAELAQQAEPVEPVAWIYQNMYTEQECLVWKKGTGGRNWRPLYTALPQRKPLTQEQLYALYDEHATHQEEGPAMSGWFDFARAIERAHGIGGQE